MTIHEFFFPAGFGSVGAREAKNGGDCRLSPGESYLVLSGDEHRHLAFAKRLRVGQQVRITDGAGSWAICSIEKISSDSSFLKIKETGSAERELVPVTIILSVIKKERMEWAVQKLSELGISRIRPVMAARSVVRGSRERLNRQQARYQKIAVEAMKQSRGSWLTVIEPVATSVQEAVHAEKDINGGKKVLVPEKGAESLSLFNLLSAGHSLYPVTVVVGPEGGFTSEEITFFQDEGAEFVDLGPRILRAETAAVVSASALALLWHGLSTA